VDTLAIKARRSCTRSETRREKHGHAAESRWDRMVMAEYRATQPVAQAPPVAAVFAILSEARRNINRRRA